MTCRNHYKNLSSALQIFLLGIDWSDTEKAKEAYNMIANWSSVTPEDALPLLDANFGDQYVRLYAAERISTFADDELVLYMLELT